MRFHEGQTIVRRTLDPYRRVGFCVAGRVVADDSRGLLLWLDRESETIRRVGFDGQPTRSLRYLDMIHTPALPAATMLHPTAGGALAFTPPNARHSVLWFFGVDGEFTGWYINLEVFIRRWHGGIDLCDQALDVLVAPDRLRWDVAVAGNVVPGNAVRGVIRHRRNRPTALLGSERGERDPG